MYLIHSPGYAEENAFWLGASDRIREGNFHWTDGQQLSYASKSTTANYYFLSSVEACGCF